MVTRRLASEFWTRTLSGAAGNGGLRKRRHAVVKRTGEPQDRQRQRRAGALAEPQIEIEQRPGFARIRHEPVPLFRRTMREDKVRGARWIDPRRGERGDRHDETVDQHRYHALRGSNDPTADRGDLEPADRTQNLLGRGI